MSGSPFADGTIPVGLPITNAGNGTVRNEADEATEKKVAFATAIERFRADGHAFPLPLRAAPAAMCGAQWGGG
jgi:hypothetical protein